MCTLSRDEASALLATYADTRFPQKAKLARDELIEFFPHSHAGCVYSAATAALALEISVRENELYPLPTSRSFLDGSGIAHDTGILNVIHEPGSTAPINVTNEELMGLKDRLSILSSLLYIGIHHHEVDPQWRSPQFGVAQMLFDSALSLDDAVTVRKIAPILCEQAMNVSAQLDLLCTLARRFPTDEAIGSRVVDLICNGSIMHDHRLDVFETVMERVSHVPIRTIMADDALSQHDKILCSPFFDEHVVRFLMACGQDFSHHHIPTVFGLSEKIGISDVIVHALAPSQTAAKVKINKPVTGLEQEIYQLCHALTEHVSNLEIAHAGFEMRHEPGR